MTWETVIGLEVHVQLATRTKMFCAQANAFGAEPNSLIDPYTLGLPGALPAPNEAAVALGTRAALAIGCIIHPVSIFARKHYFYPDLPKGYQISQYDRPLATEGSIAIGSPERGRINIGITRLHLEEDAGKSLHDRIPGRTAVDLNRAGVALVEIVSEPDLRSPAEARVYLTTLRQRLIYAGVSDCSMEKGTLRVDANLSIRRPGEKLGTKTEVKNLNSFAFVEKALEHERDRQIALLERGGRVSQVTLLFNSATGATRELRSKEDSDDYRYFPDPDLPPLVLQPDWIEAQRQALPEMPDARRERFASQYGLPAYHAATLVAERAVGDYFEAVVAAGADAKAAGDWVLETARSAWNERGEFTVDPPRLAALIALVKGGTVSKQAAKKVYEELPVSADTPKAIAERLGLVQVADSNALAEWADAVVAAHPAEVERYRGGETKLMGFFVGQVMKRSQGKADPKAVPAVLEQRLKA